MANGYSLFGAKAIYIIDPTTGGPAPLSSIGGSGGGGGSGDASLAEQEVQSGHLLSVVNTSSQIYIETQSISQRVTDDVVPSLNTLVQRLAWNSTLLGSFTSVGNSTWLIYQGKGFGVTVVQTGAGSATVEVHAQSFSSSATFGVGTRLGTISTTAAGEVRIGTYADCPFDYLAVKVSALTAASVSVYISFSSL